MDGRREGDTRSVVGCVEVRQLGIGRSECRVRDAVRMAGIGLSVVPVGRHVGRVLLDVVGRVHRRQQLLLLSGEVVLRVLTLVVMEARRPLTVTRGLPATLIAVVDVMRAAAPEARAA